MTFEKGKKFDQKKWLKGFAKADVKTDQDMVASLGFFNETNKAAKSQIDTTSQKAQACKVQMENITKEEESKAEVVEEKKEIGRRTREDILGTFS